MEPHLKTITKKTALIAFIITTFISALLIFYFGFKLILLIFAAVLISLFFEGISDFIHKLTKWNKKITLLISVTTIIGAFVFLFSIIGAAISKQMQLFIAEIPDMIAQAKNYIGENNWTQNFIPETETVKNSSSSILKYTQKLFNSTFGVLGDMYAMIFFSLFILLSPNTYKNGIIQLVPNKCKKITADILQTLKNNLQTWLKAQFISMAFIFTLTAIGLYFLDIELWLILAIIAGLLSFIPNLGPTLALIPATLVGLSDGPNTALLIVAIFLIVQGIESAVLAPYIQKNMLSLAPVLVLFAQLFLGATAGAMGILLATPILIIVVNLVQEIYIKGMLNNRIQE